MFFFAVTVGYAVFLAVAYWWAVRVSPWLHARRRGFAAVLAGTLFVQLATSWTEVHWHVGGRLHTVLVGVVMTVCIAAVPIGLMGVAVETVRRMRARKPAPTTPDPAPVSTLSRRQVVEAAGGAAFLCASGTMMGWGMVRGRLAFAVRELPVRIPGLPRALDGYVIAQVSDIHTGLYIGEAELEEGLALVRTTKPDLLVVTGDLVDLEASSAPLVARKLTDVAPRDGVYACLGNHDHYAGAAAVTAAVRAAGVNVLVNEGQVLRSGDGGGFALLGVDDLRGRGGRGGGGPRLDLASAMVPPDMPRVLLSHQPPSVERWAGRVALQLSGHTHGGQINPLGLRPADLFFRYVAGEYPVRGTTLYVNSGFGTVGPPARVDAPPEITRIVLVAA
jgi:uncharacterized protein